MLYYRNRVQTWLRPSQDIRRSAIGPTRNALGELVAEGIEAQSHVTVLESSQAVCIRRPISPAHANIPSIRSKCILTPTTQAHELINLPPFLNGLIEFSPVNRRATPVSYSREQNWKTRSVTGPTIEDSHAFRPHVSCSGGLCRSASTLRSPWPSEFQ